MANDKSERTDRTSSEKFEERLDRWRPLSWSSIFFGGLVALGISALLHILGVAVSATAIDPRAATQDNLMTVGGVTGVWFLVSTAVALFVGGFVASTLSHTFSGKRSAIYGLGVWALTTLVTLAIWVPAVISGAGNALTAAGTVAERTASAIGAAGGAAAQGGINNPGLVDRVQQTLIGTTGGEVDQNAVREITNLVTLRVTQGEWTPQQRDQLNAAVARAANIPIEDARRRVDEAQATFNSAVQQAQEALRQAAEAARMAIAGGAFWTFAAMLVGLIAAYFGARYGEYDESDLPSFARVRFGETEMRRI